jgi:GT2 family glycosyltransferase
MSKINVSIIIGSLNRKFFLKSTINNLRNQKINGYYEIIVIDGGSNDGTLQWLIKQKDIISVIQHNKGKWKGKEVTRKSWGYFMNLGLKCAKGDYIFLISDDCLIIPGSINEGLKSFTESNIAGVAFYWRNYPEMKNYWVGYTYGNKLFVNYGLFRRDAIEKVGWIDEENFNFYHADGDLSLKLWAAGYKIVDCEKAFIEHFIHFGVKNRKKNLENQVKDFATYTEKWKNFFPQSVGISYQDWKEIPFIDLSNTGKQFPRLYRLQFYLKRLFKKNLRI